MANPKPRMPTIPVPDGTLKGNTETIMALKTAVEWLQGVKSDHAAAIRCFVQNTQPVAHSVGDLWVVDQPTSSISYWTGQKWQLFAIAHADGSFHSS